MWTDDLVKDFARIYCGNKDSGEYVGLNINEKLTKFKKLNKKNKKEK